MRNEDKIELMCDSHHGVYIPSTMINRLVEAGWQMPSVVNAEVLNSPDNEYYWDEWEIVLNGALFVDDYYRRWYLHHDGDLWAVREDYEFECEE